MAFKRSFFCINLPILHSTHPFIVYTLLKLFLLFLFCIKTNIILSWEMCQQTVDGILISSQKMIISPNVNTFRSDQIRSFITMIAMTHAVNIILSVYRTQLMIFGSTRWLNNKYSSKYVSCNSILNTRFSLVPWECTEKWRCIQIWIGIREDVSVDLSKIAWHLKFVSSHFFLDLWFIYYLT